LEIRSLLDQRQTTEALLETVRAKREAFLVPLCVALRMIRAEQKKGNLLEDDDVGEVFDFLTFSSCLVSITKDLQQIDEKWPCGEFWRLKSDLSWEAHACAVTYHLLEANMISLLKESNAIRPPSRSGRHTRYTSTNIDSVVSIVRV
jgi:hypothetical protein